MNRKKLVIQIHRTPKDIIDFCLNPKNTPTWVSSFVEEKSSEWPPRVGTIYRSQTTSGVSSEYKLVALQDLMFELQSMNSPYHVRYTLRLISPDTTELEYFEWMEEGELPEPFTFNVLQKLKMVLESE